MTKRNPAIVVLLTLLTFTLYAYYWLYATTDELRRESGRQELSPALDVLLALVTFGFWGIWVAYRNAQIAHELRLARGEEHADRSVMLAGIACLSFVTPAVWLVVMALLQDELNRLAEAPDVFRPARAYRPAPRARVVAEPEVVAGADDPPVFVSSAPAPHAY